MASSQTHFYLPQTPTRPSQDKQPGFIDTTLKMTARRKRRLSRIPDPVIIPNTVPSINASSPISSARSDSFLQLPFPRTPQSPTKRLLLKPITALTAAIQKTGITGKNKSSQKSGKSAKVSGNKGGKTQKSEKFEKTGRIFGKKASNDSIKKRYVVNSTPAASAPSLLTTAIAPPNISVPKTSSPKVSSPRTLFFKSPFTPSTPSVTPPSPRSLSKFSVFHLKPIKTQPPPLSKNSQQPIQNDSLQTQKKLEEQDHCKKAQPITTEELANRLRKISHLPRTPPPDEQPIAETLSEYGLQGNSMNSSERKKPKLVLIDVRNLALYQESHIRDSFNVNLPTLLIKRYRRGNVSNFALDNFITTPEGREKYLDTIADTKTPHDFVVFDETMNEKDKVSPGWTLLNVLERATLQPASASSSSLSSTETVSPNMPEARRVFWLKGGFEAFQAWDVQKEFVRSGIDTWPPTPISNDFGEEASCGSNAESNNFTAGDTEGSSTGSGLTRRDSLFSVNTQRSSLRHKRSGQKQQQRQESELAEGVAKETREDKGDGKAEPVSIFGGNGNGNFVKAGGDGNAIPNRSRRASNGLQYLFASSNGSGRNSDQLSLYPPPTTPLDSNIPYSRRRTSVTHGLYPSLAEELSPDTPTTSPQTHPEIAFVVSTIIPDFLYLGPEISKVEEMNELKNKGVKRILNMAIECEDTLGLKDTFENYLKLCLKDSVEEDVESGLKIAVEYIAQAQKDQCPIYVHCKAGKSRSVTAVLAFLIESRRWTLRHAYDYVVERRKGICPNIGFVAELMRLEEKVLGIRRSSMTTDMDWAETEAMDKQQKEKGVEWDGRYLNDINM
ncbi:8974_t:CDS:2 [Paraglomus brasilianum]|uniref:protein-tyrosine-phosphatase n=1 Tax=Paraglomus brasilianum TaxID=144538 RepID=A0A9N9H3F9_9GLOM|nr:8974_t:CDS:2 [Paraglomus brasilianum]